MLQKIKKTIKKLSIRIKKVSPLVSTHYDLQLVKKLKKKQFPSWKQIKYIGKILSTGEKIVFKFFLFLLIGSFVWIFLIFLNSFLTSVPATGGRYTEAVIGTPQRINPLFAPINEIDTEITKLVFSGLMKFDKQQNLLQDLAESYEVSENKKNYIFRLKQNIFWHDGKPFTARDVGFTFELIQNPAVNSPLRVTFDGIKVEIVDDYTVSFFLPEAFGPFLSSLTVGILPEHIWSNIQPENMILAKQNLQPVGTGSFMFSKYSKDDNGYIYDYELKRFDDYYSSPPYIKEFVFRFFSDYVGEGGAIYALRKQQVDGLGFVPNDLKDKIERKHINLYTLEIPQYSALFFNSQKQPVLEDKSLRQALAYAIDKERIIADVWKGEAELINGPLTKGSPGYDEKVMENKFYSIEQANNLLDKNWTKFTSEEYREEKKKDLIKEWEATNGTSTPAVEMEKEIENKLNAEISPSQSFFRKNKKSQILELNLITADTAEYKKIADLVVNYWVEVGIKSNVKIVPVKDITKEIIKNRSYDILLFGVIIGSDPDQYNFWHSSQRQYPGLNLSGYSNKDVDSLLEKSRSESDLEEIAKNYAKMQEIILDEQPAIFLYTPIYSYAVYDKIKGMETKKISVPADRFNDVNDWYIKRSKKWKF